MPKRKDTDFLFLSALVREKETAFLTADQFDRMIRAEAEGEVLRILEGAGYGPLGGVDAASVERALHRRMLSTLKEFGDQGPAEQITDVFRVKYDYHNAKVLIKAEAADIDGERLLLEGGRVPAHTFSECFHECIFGDMPPALAKATVEARALLQANGDAQAADILLDRAMYREYLDLATAAGDSFFIGYIRLSIDAVNLQTAVRARRMRMDAAAIRAVLIPGGNISPQSVTEIADRKTTHTGTPLDKALALVKPAIEDGDLTAFERECDNVLTAYLGKARFVSFGLATVLSYMAALEREGTQVRIVMTGRGAKLSPDAIRERMRD